MNDAGRVRGSDGADDGEQDARELVQREEPFAIELLAERFALEQVHDHDGSAAIDLHHVVNVDDVRMPDRARRLRFTDEPLAQVRVCSLRRLEHLQRDLFVRDGVPGRPHHTHAAFADEARQHIASDCRSRAELLQRNPY